ncbi:MAG TPA: KEOPS complex subunit Cgi121 [Nitrososphaeraceae archaeon]
MQDIREFLNKIRNMSDRVHIQAINANAVYGIKHILGVLKITLENESRGMIISSKAEIDFLLRMSYTNQISLAIENVGLKKFLPSCVIIYSKDKKELIRIRDVIVKLLQNVDNRILESNEKKWRFIFHMIGLKKNQNSLALTQNKNLLTSYFIERAALVMK